MKIADLLFEEPVQSPGKPRAGVSQLDQNESIASRFARIAAEHPSRVAAADESGQFTYAELDRLSDRIARFIRSRGLAAETPVGLMFDRDRNFVASALGVLKAGCVYLPIDPVLPLERRARLLDLAVAPLLISQTALVRDLHKLHWRCPALSGILCIDAENLDAVVEPAGIMMSTELWDHLAGDAADDIAAGGWKSAFTGLPMTPQALAAFGANARAKVAPLLGGSARVLEIGCASGFTMRAVAPLAKSYTAVDISRRNVERVEAYARSHGLPHVSGHQMAAHDVHVFPPGSFDLIIMNSLIENLPGFGYLRDVLDKVLKLLAPGGALFLGSIWDLERLDAYRADLAAFARDHAGVGYKTRLDFVEDLFVPRGFFRDWASEREQIPLLDFTRIDAAGFDPAPYGYDLIVKPVGGHRTETRKHRYDRRALDSQPDGPPPVQIKPDQAAYVIYTSGTTGQPKGVLVEHSSVINLANHVAATMFSLLQPEDGLNVSCASSFAFDSSVKQIFATLLNGHTLHLPGEETKHDPQKLAEFIESRRMDLCDASPSLFAMLVDHWTATGRRTSARLFLLGGEVLQPDLLRRFYDLPGHGGVRVVNAYGPTECCVAACQHIMTAASWQAVLPPPIGTPLAGVEIQVCDTAGRPLPEGIPGEIRIGGAGVARGYLRAPELTAERFSTDSRGVRWYHTGDMGRWLPGGLLTYLGREDRQVKIRGNRIELAEVEAALTSHALVRLAAVVAADPHNDGNRVLAAYIVPRPGFDQAACKTDLEARLPPFLVPSWIVPVESIPLTVSGKIDESRLPPLNLTRSTAQGRAPATEAEHKLAALWSEVLEIPVDDVDADFFVLGGHSILAVRLISSIERAFGIRLPLADLFACPTISKLAARMSSRAHAAAWHPVVPVHASGQRTPIVCFHPVGGNVLCYQTLAETLGPDQPVYLVQSAGMEDGQQLLPTVEDMVAAYLDALRSTLPEGPLILAGWSFGGLLAFEMACRMQKAGARLDGVLLFDSVAAPDPVRDMLRKDEADYLADLFDELGLVTADELRPLTPDQRMDLLVERGRGSALLPDRTDRAGMRRLLGVFQNNALAAVRYKPRQYEGRILLVRPRTISRTAPGIPGDDFNGWIPWATGGVELRWIDGSHGQMLQRPHVTDLVEHVRAYLGAHYQQ